MAADRDQVLETIQSYLDLVGKGTADDILALYAEGATVEDPVGTEVRTTRESIREFYAAIEPLEQESRLVSARVAEGQAAFRPQSLQSLPQVRQFLGCAFRTFH